MALAASLNDYHEAQRSNGGQAAGGAGDGEAVQVETWEEEEEDEEVSDAQEEEEDEEDEEGPFLAPLIPGTLTPAEGLILRSLLIRGLRGQHAMRVMEQMHAEATRAEAEEAAARSVARAAAAADSAQRRSIWEEQDAAYAESLATDASKAAERARVEAEKARVEAAQAAAAAAAAAAKEAVTSALQSACDAATAASEAAMPRGGEGDMCELQVDVPTTRQRLRLSLPHAAPVSVAIARVRAEVAKHGLAAETSEEARADAAELVAPGALVLAFGFPPCAPLDEAAPSLQAAGVHKRERLVAKARG